jgi:hypothetical protein
MSEKTVVIWDTCGEAAVSFYICEGNLSHLDGTYVNDGDSPEADTDAIQTAIDEGQRRRDFPLDEVKDPEEEIVAVICAGVIP